MVKQITERTKWIVTALYRLFSVSLLWLSVARFLSPVVFFFPSTNTKIRKGNSEKQLQILVTSLIEPLTKYLQHKKKKTFGSNVLTRLITHTKNYFLYSLCSFCFFPFIKTGTRGQGLHLPWMTAEKKKNNNIHLVKIKFTQLICSQSNLCSLSVCG